MISTGAWLKKIEGMERNQEDTLLYTGYTSVCVCVCVCMCACMHACMRVSVHVWVCVCVSVCAWMGVCMCTCVSREEHCDKGGF